MTGKSIFAVMIVALGLIACYAKDNPLRWTEDVVTPEGQVVTLKRVQHFEKGDLVAQHSIEFQHPKTGQIIKWESDPYINFSLIALFFVDERAHILVSPRFGIDSERAGCPHPSVFIYKWESGRWEQIPYKDSPLAEIKSNATVDPKSDRERIQQSGYQLKRGSVRQLEHPVHRYTAGITLKEFPQQIFQCPAQQKIQFK